MPVDVPFTIIVIKAIQSSSSSDNCATTMILLIIIAIVIAWDHRDNNYRPHKMSCAMKNSYQIIRIVSDWESHVKEEQNCEFSHVMWRCIDFYFSAFHRGGGQWYKGGQRSGLCYQITMAETLAGERRISEEILALVTFKDKKQELCFVFFPMSQERAPKQTEI